MNRKFKWLFVSVVGFLALSAFFHAIFFRNIPSLQYQGNYFEKHLWQDHTHIPGTSPKVYETIRTWDKYVFANPLDRSIWFTGRKNSNNGLTECLVEFCWKKGSATAHKIRYDGGWKTGRDCGFDGFHLMELPPQSSIVVLLPARTRFEGADFSAFRLPYTHTSPSSPKSGGGFKESIQTIMTRLKDSNIPVPLRPTIEVFPLEVDRVVDDRR